jgi:hypothetical protein
MDMKRPFNERYFIAKDDNFISPKKITVKAIRNMEGNPMANPS